MRPPSLIVLRTHALEPRVSSHMPTLSRRRLATAAVSSTSPSEPADRFAAIGARRQAKHRTPLTELPPSTLPARRLPSLRPGLAHAFKPLERDTSPARLALDLAAERKRMAPFLRELAPTLPDPRRRLVLRTLDWRLKTEQDDADFAASQAGAGSWKNVSIPHYGPPAGRATALYRTTFALDEAMLSVGSLWVRLEGADYRARVYVNGRCLGEHEGFFATFEFEINGVSRLGENTLVIELQNDGVWNTVDGVPEGDKLYGATGPGWDGPGTGWHHCPAGMGLLGPVTIEARPRMFVHDVWTRTLPDLASVELGIEIFNCDPTPAAPLIEFTVFGENYPARLARWRPIAATEAASRGVNRYLVTVPLAKARLWSPATPWLHRAQVRLLDAPGGEAADTQSRVFGLRTFRIDETTTPKGRLFLNDHPVRLRGANTMGFEQQAVMNGRLDQLRDDFLLARLTHFNFLRLTQRPVQREVYEAADRLGVMLQTDLPLFGHLRRPQFCEAVRQASEMARHIRGHASSILASFINEPFPDHWKNLGHRHLSRTELETFFTAAAAAMRIEHPDVALKFADGDYDPPTEGLPDSHIYSLWYQGHGLAFGKLHRGHFPGVKADWCYGSGEYGAEGLDPADLMRRRYPAAWLPREADDAPTRWTADSISHAQTGRHQPLFYDRPSTLTEWVSFSQRYQAEATRWQTEAYRRHDRLVSCAIHLFIDAWPAGWMKSIVDCERRPKPAWFACRDALAPWLPMLRTDRFAVTAGETFPVELWLANDTTATPADWSLRYQLEREGRVVASASVAARTAACAPVCQGVLSVRAPATTRRETLTLRLALCDARGVVVNDHAITLALWPAPTVPPQPALVLELLDTGNRERPVGAAETLASELGARVRPDAELILADGLPENASARRRLFARVAAGATLVLTELAPGRHPILDEKIEIKACGFAPLDFASRATAHPLVADFERDDFRYWHSPASGRVEAILPATFQAPDWTPILVSGEAGWGATPRPALAAAERLHGKGRIRLSLVTLAGRTSTNPAALRFAQRLLRL